ncbi:hypothetical protein [Rubellimicrobium arenae]|uniref:hypothetical protein n=1 Tax=Rubellimicrobium arenae TaxID=2817372 RepID=UPI001B30903D|nr:hypothetical protein [Rubellimicrobium arenae]
MIDDEEPLSEDEEALLWTYSLMAQCSLSPLSGIEAVIGLARRSLQSPGATEHAIGLD